MHASPAPVRPRFVSPSTGDALVIEETLVDVCRHFERGVVELTGPVGAGKTFALRHLAAVLPDEFQVVFAEDSVDEPAGRRLIVMESNPDASPHPERIVEFELAPWTNDEFIEYLLACFPDQCQSVIERLNAAPDRHLLPGCPEVCSVVLNRFAEDDSLQTVTAALHAELNRLTENDVRRLPSAVDLAYAKSFAAADTTPELRRLLRHALVRELATILRVAARINAEDSNFVSDLKYVRDFARQVADYLTGDGLKFVHRTYSKTRALESQGILAAIVLGGRPNWKPRTRGAVLRWADLRGAVWAGIRLKKCDLWGANLSGASLRHAKLLQTKISSANLSRVNLENARMHRVEARRTNFNGARMTGLNAQRCDFYESTLVRVQGESAVLSGSVLTGADCGAAGFRNANFLNATFIRVGLDEADLSGASFVAARLVDLDLRTTRLHGTNFLGAQINQCHMEGIDAPHANFVRAQVHNCDLTGSNIPDGNFREAKLTNLGLANINWPGANLEGANLQGSTFHMGSSRSGLVDSPIASEGTRTGFYTSDRDEYLYRPIEEIRVANLMGANLVGAHIRGVDFYRVDLRGAQMTAEQRKQVLATGGFVDDAD